MALGKREDTGNIKPGSYVRPLWSTIFGRGYGPVVGQQVVVMGGRTRTGDGRTAFYVKWAYYYYYYTTTTTTTAVAATTTTTTAHV
jgi:hypothetical protein